jgi:predicted AAA+ superfamily ATPase
LFGVRGTGKSTLINQLGQSLKLASVDLLDLEQYEEAAFHPRDFIARIRRLAESSEWIFID